MRKLSVALLPALVATSLGFGTPAEAATRVCVNLETWTFAAAPQLLSNLNGTDVTLTYDATCTDDLPGYELTLHGTYHGNCLTGTIDGQINANVVGGVAAYVLDTAPTVVAAHVFLGTICGATEVQGVAVVVNV